MNQIFECFRNRREVPPQKPSAVCEMLETTTNMALELGLESYKEEARTMIVNAIEDMYEQGMRHRDQVDAAYTARLLMRLGPDSVVERVAA